jgi:hypothetical protein
MEARTGRVRQTREYRLLRLREFGRACDGGRRSRAAALRRISVSTRGAWVGVVSCGIRGPRYARRAGAAAARISREIAAVRMDRRGAVCGPAVAGRLASRSCRARRGRYRRRRLVRRKRFTTAKARYRGGHTRRRARKSKSRRRRNDVDEDEGFDRDDIDLSALHSLLGAARANGPDDSRPLRGAATRGGASGNLGSPPPPPREGLPSELGELSPAALQQIFWRGGTLARRQH